MRTEAGSFCSVVHVITLLTQTETNEATRIQTRPRSMDDILSERRLRWLGHVIRMDHQRIPRQTLHWEVWWFKRGPGRPVQTEGAQSTGVLLDKDVNQMEGSRGDSW